MLLKIKKNAISIIFLGIITFCMLGFVIPNKKGESPIVWNYVKFFVKEMIADKTISEKFNMIKLQTEVIGNKVFAEEMFVDLNTMFRHYTGTRVFEQSDKNVALLDNEYLCFLNDKTYVPYEDTDTFNELAQYLEQQEVPLLYIQAPYKLEPGNEKLPGQETDIMNGVADEFLSSITEVVPYIDLRAEIQK